MSFTNYALEQMGFERIPKGERIEANFKSINVYEIRGFISDDTLPLLPAELKRVSNDFSFSIGDSLNAICRILLGGDFVEDEEKWLEEYKSKPPYLIVLTSLIDPFVCENGYWKRENDAILTYDCFPTAKEELRKKENKHLSTFITSLTASFSSDALQVNFIPKTREVFAQTNHHLTLRDIKYIVKGECYVSQKTTTAVVASKIDEALNLYGTMDTKVGYFFNLAAQESDTLKKFIYYFLVIEIYTHQTFKELDYDASISQLNNIPQRIESSVTEFFIERQKESKNLSQRFIWCAILKWHEISDADITQFKSIKRFRDRIYHGEEVAESILPVDFAKQLALKLLKS
jgi:hypothetical protein